MEIPAGLEVLAWTAGTLGSLAVVWRRGVIPLVRFIKTLVDVSQRMEDAIPVLEGIAKEFRPNDGHSLRDVVSRIDGNVRVNARNIEVVYGVVLKGHMVDPAEAPLLEVLDPDVPDEE